MKSINNIKAEVEKFEAATPDTLPAVPAVVAELPTSPTPVASASSFSLGIGLAVIFLAAAALGMFLWRRAAKRV